ncbi:myelin protein zero-like protein 1 isoform c precursor [Mus musculus]|uniref:Myelin protein zero-like 1 n=2 Tax=Mus TaxID=862507 RepID=A0A0A6YXW1_MOUSE|nr:myelin protein zero-like protein 1 isoform c precursor [Mus musculus]|eukprot:XP_006497037.1 PREDICTED: myelin protein zero-like protein 1 isoform X1 [Mus musculus]
MAEAVGAVALIAAPARRRWLWSVLAAMLGLLTARISALEVHTPKEIFVVNGTQGKLTCTFDSPNTTGWLTTVSWSFQPDGTDSAVSGPVIYAQLDHSGGHHSGKINKSESVVYADIRKD